jgi:hypothetical protein
VQGATDGQHGRGELRCSRLHADTLRVELSGSWWLQDEFPPLTSVEQPLEAAPRVQRMTFETTDLTAWDSGLVTFFLDILDLGARREIVVDQEGLPSGVRRLLHLATAVPERQGARREAIQEPFLARVGKATIARVGAAGDLLGILGGGLIGLTVLNISPMEYFQETRAALTLGAFAQGLIKSGVYGMLVALAGCLRGMQCVRSAAAVGQAATSAVVTGIVCIITASAILTVIFFRVW